MRTHTLLLAVASCLTLGCTKQTKQDPAPDDTVLFEAPVEDAAEFDNGEPAPFELHAHGATQHHIGRFITQLDKDRGFLLAERAPLQRHQRVFKADSAEELREQILSMFRCVEHEGNQLCTTAPMLPPGQPEVLDVGTSQNINLDLERVRMSNLLVLLNSILGYPIKTDMESAAEVVVTTATYRTDVKSLFSQLVWLTEASVEKVDGALAVSYDASKASPSTNQAQELPRVFRTCGERMQEMSVFTCTARDELSLVGVLVKPDEQTGEPFHMAMITCNDTFGVIQREGSMELSMGEGCTPEERIGYRIARIEKDRVLFIALEDENRRFELRASR